MEKIIPQNGNVLCTCVACTHKTTSSGFIYKSDDAPLYKVVAVSYKATSNNIDLSEGDLIRVNSTGTLIEHNGINYYMFNLDNVVGKIEVQ